MIREQNFKHFLKINTTSDRKCWMPAGRHACIYQRYSSLCRPSCWGNASLNHNWSPVRVIVIKTLKCYLFQSLLESDAFMSQQAMMWRWSGGLQGLSISQTNTLNKKKKVSFLYLFCFYPDCSCFHLPPFLQKETFITTLLKFLLVRVKRVSCGVVLSRRAAPPQPPCAPRRVSVTTLRSSQLPLIYSPPPCVYM